MTWARRTRRPGRGKSSTRSSTTATSSGCRRLSPLTGGTRTSTSVSALASSTCATPTRSTSRRKISACVVTPVTFAAAARSSGLGDTNKGLGSAGRDAEQVGEPERPRSSSGGGWSPIWSEGAVRAGVVVDQTKEHFGDDAPADRSKPLTVLADGCLAQDVEPERRLVPPGVAEVDLSGGEGCLP